MKPYRTLCSELRTNSLLNFHFINFAKSLHSEKEFLIETWILRKKQHKLQHEDISFHKSNNEKKTKTKKETKSCFYKVACYADAAYM